MTLASIYSDDGLMEDGITIVGAQMEENTYRERKQQPILKRSALT